MSGAEGFRELATLSAPIDRKPCRGLEHWTGKPALNGGLKGVDTPDFAAHADCNQEAGESELGF